MANLIGTFLDRTGTALGLPEWNLSERFGVTSANSPNYMQSDPNSVLQPGMTVDQANQALQQKNTAANYTVPSKGTTSYVPSSTPAPSPTSQVPTEDPRIGEANNYFNQANQLLDQQVALLGSTQATALQGIENYTGQQKSAYQEALDRAKGLAGTQKNETLLNQRSAESENIRNFNNLNQQAMSRYGQGSSAGGALTEILGQTFLRTAGSLREKTQATFQKIFDYESQSERDYAASVKKLEEDKALAIQQNADKFQAGLLEIATMRNTNEQAKANLRIQVLTDNINRARELEDYSKQLKDSYDMWLAQQKVSAEQGWTYANDLYSQAVNANLFSQQGIQETTQPLASLGISPTTSNTQTSYYKQFNKDEDELKSINPWLA